jgi:sec-independent protein translocase protein TatB
MFGIDSPELLVILVVALVVIGPKELPTLLKTWGKWMATMRGMAAEFRGHVDEMVRQSELDQVKKQLESSTGGLDFKSLDPTKEMRSIIQEGVTEGEKALAEAKTSLDNPLVEPPPAAPEALAAVVSPGEPEAAVPPEFPLSAPVHAAAPLEAPAHEAKPPEAATPHDGKPHEAAPPDETPKAAAAG